MRMKARCESPPSDREPGRGQEVSGVLSQLDTEPGVMLGPAQWQTILSTNFLGHVKPIVIDL